MSDRQRQTYISGIIDRADLTADSLRSVKWDAITPTSLALSSRLTLVQLQDVYFMAGVFDTIAEEARENERNRIFQMGFIELFKEFWRGRKLYAPARSRGNLE